MTNVIWIDQNADNEENTGYFKLLKSMGSLKVRLFKNTNDAIHYLKKIKFEETQVIISGRLYDEFIENFKENSTNMYVVPKIIIFTSNAQKIITNNKENKNIFGISPNFEEIKIMSKEIELLPVNKNRITLGYYPKFVLLKNNTQNFLFEKHKMINLNDTLQLTFEYIDNKEKLMLPMFFKSLIDDISKDNLDNYTKKLYSTYSKQNNNIKQLLGSIESITNIPIEILSKYYARLYTFDSDFYRNLNKDLGTNQIDKYLPFIKILYEGVKLKSLSLANENMLYRGSKISNIEIEKIKSYLKKKINGLPGSIVFCRTFLSFSKDKNKAEFFLSGKNENKNLSKVFYIIEKDDTIGYNLSTHADIEKISFYPDEKEVLFFPFSSFEVKDIKEKVIKNEKVYNIQLLYLGKYLKNIENDKRMISNEIKIPDSEFKKQLTEFGLIKEEKMQNINTKIIYNNYEQYKKEIEKSIIFGEIDIHDDDLNKYILLINSVEKQQETFFTSYLFMLFEKIIIFLSYICDGEYDENDEDKEIEIKIDGNEIVSPFFHKFRKKGKYKISFIFSNNLTKANNMFCGCSKLTKINLSKFNTQNINNMSNMFAGCYSLTNIDLSNFNTQKVTDMSYMFSNCKSLTYIDLSNFKTQNVKDMYKMFFGCSSLTNIDLYKFNTQKVTNMRCMFHSCKALTGINLLNFKIKDDTEISGMFAYCNNLNIVTKNNRILREYEMRHKYESNNCSGCLIY